MLEWHIAQYRYKCPKCRQPYCSVACCRAHKAKKNGCVSGSTTINTKAGDESLASEPSQQHDKQPKSRYLPSDLLLRDPDLNAEAHRRRLIDSNSSDNISGNGNSSNGRSKRNTNEEYEDLEDGWKITTDMMDAMDKCDWLHQELADGGLRQMIFEIVSSSRIVNGAGQSHQEEALARLQSTYPNFRTFITKLQVVTGVLEREPTPTEEDDGLGPETIEEWLQRRENLGPVALKPLPRYHDGDSNVSDAATVKDSDSSSDSDSESDGSDSEDDDDDDE